MFTHECQAKIHTACAITETHFDAVTSGNIEVNVLKDINNHLDTFSDIITLLKKQEDVRKEAVEKTVKMRLKEVEEFVQQQGLINMFANLCQHTKGTIYDKKNITYCFANVCLSVRPSVRPSVCPSVRPSVQPLFVRIITLKLQELSTKNFVHRT